MNGAAPTRAASTVPAFVWRTLKDRFNLPMDRVTTGDLLHMGVRVSKQQLRPGDLVFFRIHGGMHVGFYDTDHNFPARLRQPWRHAFVSG